MISNKYIAGFFDGEGSAMILTDNRHGGIFRLRPVIKIAQKTRGILDEIKKHLGFGTIFPTKTIHTYQINGHDKVLKFIEEISPYAFLKKEQLFLLKKLIELQYRKGSKPYTKKEVKNMVIIRDKVHLLNTITKSNIKQKYPKNLIMKKYE